MSIDLALDPTTGDLFLSNLDLKIVDGMDAFEQRLRSRLRFYLNEWFLEITVGLPYYDSILVKNPNIPDVENIIKAEILETEDSEELLAFDSEYSSSNRSYSVTFKVKSKWGISDFNETLFVE